jgi:hypothetical protein
VEKYLHGGRRKRRFVTAWSRNSEIHMLLVGLAPKAGGDTTPTGGAELRPIAAGSRKANHGLHGGFFYYAA